MKWRNHKIVTFCAAYAMTGGIVPSAAAMIGSVLPDVLELGGLVAHRTVTHYLLLWCGAMWFMWTYLQGGGSGSVPAYIGLFVVAGGTLHVLEDALSIGGVPVLTPFGRKAGLGVYRTDTIGEEVTAAGLVFIFIFFAFARGFFESGHLGGQVAIASKLIKQCSWN